MAKLSPEERAALEKQLADDDDADDESDEVSLTFPDGHSFSGSYRRAKEVAAARGFKLKADPKPDADEGKTNVKRFNAGRRTG